ncbi:S-layer homology domain-containing protein [Aliterella atlantica]|uniref:SLH domain-containing protein n=1 Tax=Aliterella atlantica CENA595 TaxID=1618023 RepID=A0A0D8ZRR0_9CYAN|nr:S-layer homology domain-containing protein [Aliterella atlantica]KJH71042.1 hypothetical protein UH38_14740 [Aliterella atlantica CENA595]
MSNSFCLNRGSAALLAIGMSASAVVSFSISAPALAQNNFPDVDANYWAQPFIERLAAQHIISGYPDGTFRPEQALDRDEFAALIRDAFNQNQVRQIPSGSVFKDVPSGYWAASAIEEAYETGFMRGFPGGLFQPREEVSRVQALVSLANGLNLSSGSPQATTSTTTSGSPQATTSTTTSGSPQATASTTTNQAVTPATTPRVARKQKFIPLAIVSLMEPLLLASANAQAAIPSGSSAPLAGNQAVSPSSNSSTPSEQNVAAKSSLASVVSKYYTDVEQIPQYAIDDVAAATKANIVVNYPNVKVLNPNEPLSRGAAAAIIHQTLVHQGKLPPLPSTVESSNYIVGLPTK